MLQVSGNFSYSIVLFIAKNGSKHKFAKTHLRLCVPAVSFVKVRAHYLLLERIGQLIIIAFTSNFL